MVDIRSYEQLMAREDIDFISEYDGYLYVKLYPTEQFDNSIWKVDKTTHDVSYAMFTDYIANVYGKDHYLVKPKKHRET